MTKMTFVLCKICSSKTAFAYPWWTN